MRKSSRVPRQTEKAAGIMPKSRRQKKSNFSKYCAPKGVQGVESDDSDEVTMSGRNGAPIDAGQHNTSVVSSSTDAVTDPKRLTELLDDHTASLHTASHGSILKAAADDGDEIVTAASTPSSRVRKPSAKATAILAQSIRKASPVDTIPSIKRANSRTPLHKPTTKRTREVPGSDDELASTYSNSRKKVKSIDARSDVFDFPRVSPQPGLPDEKIASAPSPAHVVETPKKAKTLMKKVLVGGLEDDDLLPDSPSHAASIKLTQRQVRDSAIESPTSGRNSNTNTPTKVKSQLVMNLTPTKSGGVRQLFATPTKSQPDTPKSLRSKRIVVPIPEIDVEPEQIVEIKAHILEKITKRVRVPLLHLEAQYTAIHNLLRETIVRAESNSALIIGPRGIGKTLLVDTAISDFKATNTGEFLVVRLDGMVQTDDRLALRDMARQLQPDGDHDAIANADIMTSLLAILAHPSEFGESGESVSVIIVLEEFGRFTEHPRQTLLYNLFDIAQSKKAPICVLGVTDRVDAYESLEKRVKSRFSHRVVQVQYLSTLVQFKSLCLSGILYTGTQETVYTDTWNDYVSTNADLDRLMEFTFLGSGCVDDLWRRLVLPLAKLDAAFPSFSSLVDALEPRRANQPPTVQSIDYDPRISGKLESLLPCLSTLELSLLISAARLVTKDLKLNFATCFDEYRSLSQKTNLTQKLNGVTNLRSYSRTACRGAFERLLGMSLLSISSGGGRQVFEFKPCKVDVLLIDLAQSVKGYRAFNSSMNQWISL